MKKSVFVFLMLGVLMSNIGFLLAMPDPSSSYCQEMGYSYEEEDGIYYCVFSEEDRCESWSFYGGECGQEFIIESDCITAGNRPGASTECCEGLTPLATLVVDESGDYDWNEGCAIINGPLGFCSDCGNGVCEDWENRCNCEADCSDTSTEEITNLAGVSEEDLMEIYEENKDNISKEDLMKLYEENKDNLSEEDLDLIVEEVVSSEIARYMGNASCNLIKNYMNSSGQVIEVPKEVPFTSDVFTIYVDEKFMISLRLEEKELTDIYCESPEDTTYNIYISSSVLAEAVASGGDINPIDFYLEKSKSGDLKIKPVGFGKKFKFFFLNLGIKIASVFI